MYQKIQLKNMMTSYFQIRIKKYIIFLNLKEILRIKKVFLGEVNKIKYKIFTELLFNIYLILLLYSSISISVVQKHFSMFNSQIVV